MESEVGQTSCFHLGLFSETSSLHHLEGTLLVCGSGLSLSRSGLCSLEPHAVRRALALLSCSNSTGPGPGLGGFPGLLPYRLFWLPFCWGYQSSGFLGWLCFNLSPRSRLRGLPLSLGREEMEDPGSLWGRLWSQRISRNRCRDRPAAPRPRQPASLQTGPVNY